MPSLWDYCRLISNLPLFDEVVQRDGAQLVIGRPEGAEGGNIACLALVFLL